MDMLDKTYTCLINGKNREALSPKALNCMLENPTMTQACSKNETSPQPATQILSKTKTGKA